MTETFGSDLPTGRDEEVVLQVAETTGTCKVLRHYAPLEGNLGQTVTPPNSAVEENLNPGDSTWNYGGGATSCMVPYSGTRNEFKKVDSLHN